MTEQKKQVPIEKKATLSFKEAAIYYGIGEKALRAYIAEHKDPKYIVQVGVKDIRIKRVAFEKHLSENVSRI